MELIYPNWDAPSNVKAVSSTRIGGVSSSPYRGLNLGTHVGDDERLVEENRSRLISKASMPTAPVWLNQTHSTRIVNLVEPTDNVLDGDGAVTNQSGIVCSAMTADCLPVLLTDSQGTQVAAVHAGWRGLADGILEEALSHFSGNVMAWLGPAIGQNAFEVGEDVRTAFSDVLPQAVDAFSAGELEGKWFADMNQLATQRLNKEGVSRIFKSELCTYSDPQRFYSYRRDGVTGRMASFIWLE
ncbi:putative Cytotoxic necrotizing factor-like/Multi-copper polyphenol oxidoreductase,laccase [Vibrio nigripulchritudo SOn1]|uniref:Purine nucleoside phosphorylase n=1 Tax=Vibrio nigripulchritudo SOn1 TaxID=1238450 RepID=A0AAV2VI90_9VIBR|nr:peptidoglycan editing factor PgeF [Vibrio nigripulchritudo]CCO44450.1 putative Cytotoxic necrotizing factor-like/Multi-copper polyphenol oxidoreductase,laccase [Vibrio nigripulchritudo SOn1]